MSDISRRNAVASHRARMRQRGLARYEVRGLAADMPLIRRIAQRLAAQDEAAERMRAALDREAAESEPARGGILAALRRSPLVGADLDLTRDETPGRDTDL